MLKQINSILKNGVKQGGILSPFLFEIYLDQLLQKSKIGYFVGNIVNKI